MTLKKYESSQKADLNKNLLLSNSNSPQPMLAGYYLEKPGRMCRMRKDLWVIEPQKFNEILLIRTLKKPETFFSKMLSKLGIKRSSPIERVEKPKN